MSGNKPTVESPVASPPNIVVQSVPLSPASYHSLPSTSSAIFRSPNWPAPPFSPYSDPVTSPPIHPQPRSRSANNDSDSDIEEVYRSTKLTNTVPFKQPIKQEANTNNTIASKKRRSNDDSNTDFDGKNLCELMKMKDGVDEKKRNLLAEYFEQDALSQRIGDKIKKQIGY